MGGRSEGLCDFPPETLEAVIFGCQMSVEDKAAVRKLAEDTEQKILFKEAKRMPDRYELQIVNC